VKFLEDWKIKIAALWLIAELVAIVGNLIELYEPGFVEGLIAGEYAGMQITPELMVLNAILFLIAPLMAFLSLTLKDSINRWANIIVGIVLTAFGFLTLAEYLAQNSAYLASEILVEIAWIVATALIVWHAWKSKPKI
jgi:positive regulator of sigma E activity